MIELPSRKIVCGASLQCPIYRYNQGNLSQSLAELFDYAEETGFVDCDHHHSIDKGHGRLEIRECWTTSDVDYLRYLPDRAQWQGLNTPAILPRAVTGASRIIVC